ncbi:hypothetical protein EJB05_13867, partial [Eragrostis curvula]
MDHAAGQPTWVNNVDVFIGPKQRRFRDCVPLHCPISITFAGHEVGQRLLPIFQTAIHTLGLQGIGFEARQDTTNSCYVAFTTHSSAARAHRALLNIGYFIISAIKGHITKLPQLYRFEPKLIAARINVRVIGLPLHLWSEEVIERILGPFCGIDYIPPDLHSQTDLSAFQCIGWTYRSVWIPSDMRIKVVGQTANGCHRKALIYNISLQVQNYKYGVGTSPPTNEGYPSNTWEPNCHIDAASVDHALIQRYSRSVVIEGPGIFNEAILDQIKQTYSFQPVGYQTAIVSPETALHNGLNLHLSLQEIFKSQCSSYVRMTPWSPDFVSVDEVPMQFSRISLNHMPCFFITKHIVHHLLSPYGLAELLPSQETEHKNVFLQSFTSINNGE